MLKIKDNVDLTQLEFLGWKKSRNRDAWYSYRNPNCKDLFIGIKKGTREILYDKTPSIDDEAKELAMSIFALTSAGLVEKVGDEK